MPVAEALRDADGDHIPDRLGQSLTLSGVITSTPRVLYNGGASRTTMQDYTGGIRVVAGDSSLAQMGLQVGDVVTVTGVLAQKRGREEIQPGEIKRLGPGIAPLPITATAAELNSHRYEGGLVRISGRLLPAENLNPLSRTVKMEDATGKITVYIARDFFQNPTFIARLREGGTAEIVGIAAQDDPAPPFDSGFRIVPRDASDFVLRPSVPYLRIGLGAFAAFISAWIAHLWARRRAAEGQAREVAALLTELQRSQEAHRAAEVMLHSILQNAPAVKIGRAHV